jgi:hypothetical protein
MNNKMTVVIISLSMLMSLAVSAAGRPSLRAHEQRITTLEGQTSTLATDLADIALTPGPKGDVGEAGTKGAEGVKGDVGEAGTQGTPGIKGDDGAAGNRGEDGSDGLNGIDAIAGTANGQMQYWDGDTWQVISAPDMMISEAQVLTPHDGGFRWVPAHVVSPGNGGCPAYTLDTLRFPINAAIYESLFWQGQKSNLSYSVSGEYIAHSYSVNSFDVSISFSLSSANGSFSKFRVLTDFDGRRFVRTYYLGAPDDTRSNRVTQAQIQACYEILGHASLPVS